MNNLIILLMHLPKFTVTLTFISVVNQWPCLGPEHGLLLIIIASDLGLRVVKKTKTNGVPA